MSERIIKYAVKNMGITRIYDTRVEAEKYNGKIYEIYYYRDDNGNLYRPGGHHAAFCYSRFCIYCGTEEEA